MSGRTVEGVMSLLESVASGEGFNPGRGPELLALSVLTLGPDGEINGEPGTGRVPSLFANHGFQVRARVRFGSGLLLRPCLFAAAAAAAAVVVLLYCCSRCLCPFVGVRCWVVTGNSKRYLCCVFLCVLCLRLLCW